MKEHVCNWVVLSCLFLSVGCAGEPGTDAGDLEIGAGDALPTERICTGTSSTTEAYNLPAPSTLPAGVSFLTDWEHLDQAGGFRGWQAMDRCRIQVDPTFQTWHGKVAVRVEVNPDDDPIGSSGERSEVLFMQDPSGNIIYENNTSGRQFFALSYYFPSSWAGTFLSGNSESWSLVFQFHDTSGGYFAGMHAGVRFASEGQKFYYTTSGGPQDLGQIRLGEWVDFVISIDFSTGDIYFYRRNEGETTFSEVLYISDSAATDPNDSYFKQGLYRGTDVAGRTDVLWMGPTARGTSFSAVEQAAFGTDNGYI